MKTFFEHYKQLFTDDSIKDPLIPISKDTLAAYIPQKIQQDYSKFLDHNLSLEEIDEAMYNLALEKSPGLDGLPMEFYRTLWHHIREEFYNVYLEGIETGSLGVIINQGLIKLIPKEKQEDSINGWRPITLLNTSYKIIAKALSKRIKPITQEIVRSEQTSFLGGKFILDNLILAWESVEWAQQTVQDALILKLDFDKAYDRI